MAWAVPNNSLNQVDKAGKYVSRITHVDSLETLETYQRSIGIVNNWRASHQYPLNIFQMTLRRKARRICDGPIISQRIKRMESIQRKLSASTMQLSQMQDIGGCRVVLPSSDLIYKLVDVYKTSHFNHRLKNEKDYIKEPKSDGYRSYHMIYKFASETPVSEPYQDMQIEIQIRSQYQHAWATAVEAVSTFTKQALKWRSGDADWREFFELMSTAIVLIEGPSLVGIGQIDKKSLGKRIKILADKLHVKNSLKAYTMTLNYAGSLKQSKAKLLLVQMRPDEARVQVEGFRLDESRFANDRYLEAEKNIPSASSAQAVLVRVDSVNSLRKAYPNYFLDTEVFSRILTEVMKW